MVDILLSLILSHILPASNLLLAGLSLSELLEQSRICLNQDVRTMGLSIPHLEPGASMVYGYLLMHRQTEALFTPHPYEEDSAFLRVRHDGPHI